jgi:hypothetical protein
MEGRNYGGAICLSALCTTHSFGATLRGRTFDHTHPQFKITSHRNFKTNKSECQYINRA